MQYGIPEQWTVKEGTHQGKKMLVRKRELRVDEVRSKYPFQIGIAIPYAGKTQDGFPDEKEQTRLSLIEDALIESLTNVTEGLYVAVITTNGMRELVFYMRSWLPEEFEKKVKIIESNLETHQLQFMMKKDQEWLTFTSL